jgi:hypothetical protein
MRLLVPLAASDMRLVMRLSFSIFSSYRLSRRMRLQAKQQQIARHNSMPAKTITQ